MPGPSDFIKKWDTVKHRKGKGYKGNKPWKKPSFLQEKEKTYINVLISLLNKVSIDNYNEIKKKIYEVIECLNENEKTQFIKLILEKSKDEQHFIEIYVKLIVELNLQSILLKCYKEIYNNTDKINNDKLTNEILYRKREQGIGYFIAKIVNKGIIVDNEIVYWIDSFIDQFRLECLCKYIQIVDKKKQSSNITYKIMNYLQSLINENSQKIQNSQNIQNLQKITSKQKFMILDIQELEKNNWKVLRETHKEITPDSKENIRKDRKKQTNKILENIDVSVKNCLNECFLLSQQDAINELLLQFKDYQSYMNFTIIKKQFVYIAIENALEKDSIIQYKTKFILNYLYQNKIIQSSIYHNVFSEFYSIIDDLRIDIPKIDSILESFKIN